MLPFDGVSLACAALATALLLGAAVVPSPLSLTTGAMAAIPGDVRRRQSPDEKDVPYMTAFITASRINYPSHFDARDALDRIHTNKINYIEEMQEQQDRNVRHKRNGEANYCGELGLLSYDQLPKPTADILFDVRQPISESPQDLLGPICDENGCSIYAVLQRFRRSFFSKEWNDAEQFCLNGDMDFGQFLQSLASDSLKSISSSVWPDDTPTFRRLKMQQVLADVSRMKHGDPSTRKVARPRSLNLGAHNTLMETRTAFFKAYVTEGMIEEHPEIFALELHEIVASGWIDTATVERDGLVVKFPATDPGATVQAQRRAKINAEAAETKAGDGVEEVVAATSDPVAADSGEDGEF